MAWFADLLPAVARHFRGAENVALSKPEHLRFGKQGSLSVERKNGAWIFFDHEKGQGGGVIDFLRVEAGLVNGAALAFMEDEFKAKPPERIEFALREGRKTVFRYLDGDGVPTLEVVREDFADAPKKIRQRIPLAGGGFDWQPSGKWAPIPYRLPDLLAAKASRSVFIVEGEKCADALAALGLVATTNAMGAKKFQPELVPYFKGRHVIIVPDHDRTGYEHAIQVSDMLTGTAASIRLVQLPGLPEKGDVIDWLSAGGTKEKLVSLAQEAPQRSEHTFDVPEDVPEPRLVETVEAFAFEASQVPPRPWIVNGMLLHGYVGLLVGTGGAGKSLFSLQLATAVAAGESWGGFVVRRPSRVMILNAEDDIAEQRRRLLAIKARMGVDTSGIGDRFILANDPPSLLITRRDLATKTQVASPLVAELVETIRRKAVDVLIVDPFAETIAGDENESEDIRWVMKIWRDEIARATGCAVLLVHHTPKYSAGMAGDANAARGSGSINNAARTSWTVFPMTSDEAKGADIAESDRHKFVRVDDAKANYGLLSGTARWFQKAEVDIENGTDHDPSDRVGVLLPWSPPGPFAGLSYDAINHCLDVINRGVESEDLQPTGQRYALREDAGTRYVGNVIQERLGVDADRAKRIAKAWRESGLLVEDEYHDPVARKPRKGLRVDATKRPAPGTIDG